jgi:hypothetical protein
MTEDAKARVAEYQLACQRFKGAERDAEQATKEVQAQAALLEGWRKLRLPCQGDVVTTRASLPRPDAARLARGMGQTEILTPPDGVIAPPDVAPPAGEADSASVMTPAPFFDENKWPSAETIVKALLAFQEASEKLYQSWGALREDERTGFVGPDDLTAQPSLAP